MRPRCDVARSLLQEFQSTHPRGVRLFTCFLLACNLCFNPRTHEGCDASTAKSMSARLCFNPRTHEGCDRLLMLLILNVACFNPRTHEGCDLSWCVGLLRERSFNPRTHEGCDRYSPAIAVIWIVSIHAPTRGATAVPRCIKPKPRFQSTHPRGVRPEIDGQRNRDKQFQSTHPRGVRQK